ncbi:hypothetical protein F5146DRAFT_761030 [Armillaria mellea]|nr:hypothetical protein F5146DRAFT_761030 [Armillaria mellea]
MIRTYAIWDRHRMALWWFIGIVIFCFTPVAVGPVMQLRSRCGLLAICNSRELNAVYFAVVGPIDHNCLSHSSKMPNFLYIPALVSGTIIASLTLFKGIQHFRRSSHLLLTEFYVSVMFFYVCLLLITLANILLPMRVHNLTFYQTIFHSVLSSHHANHSDTKTLILSYRRTVHG